MLNIIKSIRYSMRRELVTWGLGAVVLMIYGLLVAYSIGDVDEYTGAYGFRAAVSNNEILVLAVSCIFVPMICASDFSDKFINYELLGGFKKKHSYFARALHSYAFVYIYFIISCLIPLVIGCVMNGYQSTDLQVNDLFMLLLFGFVMVFRWVSIVIFFSFLFENGIASVIIVYLLEVFAMMPSLLLGEEFEELKRLAVLSSTATYETVMNPSDMLPGFVNGKDVYVPVYNFGGNTGAIVVSLVFGTVLLIAGYCVFRSRDRK